MKAKNKIQSEQRNIPAPIDDRILKGLFEYLYKELGIKGCKHDLTLTIAYLKDHGVKDIDNAISWLQSKGGYCDCEVLMNVVEKVVAELVAGMRKGFFLRYSNNIHKDIDRGVSYHYTGLDKSSFETAEEVAEAFNIPAEGVVYNEDAGQWLQELPGLCAFELESNNIDDAIEEAKEFRYNNVYNSEDMQNWHILEGCYVGDCLEGDIILVEKILYSNNENL